MSSAPHHVPVLLEKAVELLAPSTGETVLDVTLGLGGHAETFLKKIGDTGRLIGLDADSVNLEFARKRLSQLPGIIELHHRNFASIDASWLPPVDILFADLGVSSPHFDDPERGFSFRQYGPLDMRYDRSSGMSAGELLMSMKEEELFRMFADYGELPGSAKLARAIYSRLHGPTMKKDDRRDVTTEDMKKIVEEVFGYKAPSVLPQVFQALRIAVNDELGALRVLLEKGPFLLRPGGRMGVISYHSLEDRLVKKRCKELSEAAKDPQTGAEISSAPFELITKKPVNPTDEEIASNPRSRSAHFRVLRRLTD